MHTYNLVRIPLPAPAPTAVAVVLMEFSDISDERESIRSTSGRRRGDFGEGVVAVACEDESLLP